MTEGAAPVAYALDDGVATITLDDGKVNALSGALQAEIHAALERAGADGAAAVVLAGRDGTFSAGFDLGVFRSGDAEAARAMVIGGFELAERLLSFPAPVIGACTGHALAMGLFLLQSVDYRVGAEGQYRLAANEVAIGLTMPRAAVVLLRQRLTPATFNHATLLATTFSPVTAVGAGLLDEVVPPDDVRRRAREVAVAAAALDHAAHAATKRRAREAMLRELREAIESDDAELAALAGS